MVYGFPVMEHFCSGCKPCWIRYMRRYSTNGGFYWPLLHNDDQQRPVERGVNPPLPPKDAGENTSVDDEGEIDVVGLDGVDDVIEVVSLSVEDDESDVSLIDEDEEIDVVGLDGEEDEVADPSLSVLGSSTRRRGESDEEQPAAKRPRWSDGRD